MKRIESLVKIKRKDSLIVEFLIRKSKICEKPGVLLLRRMKGTMKKGLKEMNNLSFFIKAKIKPVRLMMKKR